MPSPTRRGRPSRAITTATRASTAGGTSISLSGTGFIEGMTVLVNGVATTDVKLAGATKVMFAAPAGEAGVASATVRNPDNQTATAAGAGAVRGPAGHLKHRPQLR